ncbi:MAG: PaaI family thioesterase [Acidimicrobiales bacterium]
MTNADGTFPLQDFIGFTIEHDQGQATASVELDERHMNPNEVTHGAIPFTLMDTAMGAAVMSVIGEQQYCATIEMHTRFHRGSQSGRLTATAEVVTTGRKVIHLSATTTDADGRVVATATSSYAVIDGPAG